MQSTKLKRGQKVCNSCNGINAARQRLCKHCSAPFGVRAKNTINDWQNLNTGDIIKVIQGSGPYYVVSKDNELSVEGERIPLYDAGVYRVVGKDDQGLKVYNSDGYTYLYMGKPYVSKSTGTHFAPFKIVRK